jgi:mono/diheme cytochrome c family protein
MTDDDLADLKAYVDSIAPVKRPDTGQAASLALLARARDAIGMALATNVSPSAPPAASSDPAIARGAYLVASVGHCGDCHTPRTWFGSPDSNRELAGSKGGLEGRSAPNITSDAKSGIGSWSVDDIVYLLKQGGTPDGDFVGGSMVEIVRNTARLTDDDRRAIAVYLKALPGKVFDKNK